MATPISFGFSSASTYGNRFDLTARAEILSANGFAIVTNGMDPNQKIEPEFGMTDLIPRAPIDEVYPLLTAVPSSLGKIFGNNFKWRIRYRNSRTGETTGLSPLPNVGANLGVTVYTSSTVATFLGQTAYFSFAGFAYASAGDARAGMDTFDLFRNTSDQTDVFYLVDSKANPGAGSYVAFTDNTPDEDLWNNEQADLRINPTYYTPLPPPCIHSFLHSTGRVFLYGRYNMGPKRSGTDVATMSAGDTLITTTNGFFFRGREGQLFNFVTDPDKVQYRIVEVTGVNTFYVTPPAPAAVSSTWEVIDDIDSRTIYMMEPNQPWSWDSSNAFNVGLDLSDGVQGVFAIGTRTFVLTRHHLWALLDDISEDPKTTLRIQRVADVGACGPWAWCNTPYGVVFVDENHGVMAFSGEGLPTPLGSEDPMDDFKPKTQFQGFDRGLLSETYCEWDPDSKRVIVAYCPTGVGAMVEQLSFDPIAGNWRGPWRRPIYRGGKLRNSTGKDVFLLGDVTGTLMYEGDIATDLVAASSGTVASLDNPVLITDSLGTFSGAKIGAPILFNDAAGNYYLNWIVRAITSSQIQLLLVPEVTIQAGWTYQVGVIHWQAKTAFIDLNEPGQPKALRKLEVGYNRVSTGADNLIVDCVTEGCSITESADAVTPVTGGLIKSSVDVNNGGTAFTLRFSGRAQYGNVQITKMLAHVTVCSGEEVPTTTYRTKVTITPTVTS